MSEYDDLVDALRAENERLRKAMEVIEELVRVNSLDVTVSLHAKISALTRGALKKNP